MTPKKPAGLWIGVFRLGGIRVYADPLVIALLALVFLAGESVEAMGPRLLQLGIVLGSVFLHELAHVWMARRRGLVVSGVFLHLIPFAYVERGKPADELRVALAGPAANLLVALVLLLIPGLASSFPWFDAGAWLQAPLWTLLGINLLMGVVNLMPALPVDGGRALRAALLLRMPPGSAYAYTARVGTFVGAGLLCVATFLWVWPASAAIGALGLYVIVVAWREARAGQRERRHERAQQRSTED